MALLGVNIDHVATIRQARRTYEPDPVHAAVLAELGGADGITVHLREDRRHIQDRDVRLLRQMIRVKLNLEMAVSDEITQIALEVLPEQATLVPEKREEVTTEGGLDVITHRSRVADCVKRLQSRGIAVSLFIDPEEAQIAASAELGVEAVELHTGAYADANGVRQQEELARLVAAAGTAVSAGLILNMGHGLTYRNVEPIARISGLHELNIGHSIISHAVMVGLERAVREMKLLIHGGISAG
ncbi:MAG: pyridoxine 5'-phosphate synthase [Planctomycetaceae bacterium]|nr:pyridoxine 5'-phosphate synthase [Planctomycetaceae bacterium]